MDVMNKNDLIAVMEEYYEVSEYMYDNNLTKMAQLHEQIESIKEANTAIAKRMKETAAKIRKYQEEIEKGEN